MKSLTFSDFSGGWYGTLDPAKADPNTFDSRNIILYRDGSLGPRAGLKAFNLGRTTTGKITGFHYTLHDTKNLLYVDGTHVWAVKADNSGTGVVDLGALTGAVNTPVADLVQPFVNFDTQYTYISNLTTTSSGRPWRIDLNAGTMTVVSASPGPALSMSFYGTRMVRGAGLVLYYSTRLAPTSWPSTNFINIGLKGSEIVFVAEFRNHLTILTRDGQWWVLTGVPGVNDTLRRMAEGFVRPAWISPAAVVTIADEGIYYLSPENNFPGLFDGATHKEFQYLTMSPESGRASYASSNTVSSYLGVKALQAGDPNEPAFILVAPTNRMLVRHHGVWVLHQFGVDVGQSWAQDGQGRMFLFGPPQAAANTPSYVFNLHLDRPAFVSDTFAQPGDNTTTPLDAYITFPEQWSATSDLWQVKEVVVDFTRWDTGAPVNNRIDVKVESLGRGSELDDGEMVRTWQQPGSLSPATMNGQRDRVRLQFGEQGAGAGCRVTLENIRGVAIRSVTVNYELVEQDGRL